MSDPQDEPRSVLRRLAGGAAILVGALALLTGRVSCGVGVDNGTVVDLDNNRFRPPATITGPSLSPGPDGVVAHLAARAQEQLPASAIDVASIVHAVYSASWGEVLFFGGTVTDADSLLTAFRVGAERNHGKGHRPRSRRRPGRLLPARLGPGHGHTHLHLGDCRRVRSDFPPHPECRRRTVGAHSGCLADLPAPCVLTSPCSLRTAHCDPPPDHCATIVDRLTFGGNIIKTGIVRERDERRDDPQRAAFPIFPNGVIGGGEPPGDGGCGGSRRAPGNHNP